MSPGMSAPGSGRILLIGASRGLGLGLAAAFLRQGWEVVATRRVAGATGLDDLAARGGRITIAPLDITEPDQIAALRDRLGGQQFDILFCNAGIADANPDAGMADIDAETFQHVMLTNAWAPMRVIECLQDLVQADGLIGVMSSGQGSIANNRKGGHALYRASKAALNQLMRSYAARPGSASRALLLLAPGWIRTALGGPDAPYAVAESVPKILAVLLAQRGRPGLHFLDRDGQAVPW